MFTVMFSGGETINGGPEIEKRHIINQHYISGCVTFYWGIKQSQSSSRLKTTILKKRFNKSFSNHIYFHSVICIQQINTSFTVVYILNTEWYHTEWVNIALSCTIHIWISRLIWISLAKMLRILPSSLPTDLTLPPTVGIASVGSASVKRGLFCGESLQRAPRAGTDSTDALRPARQHTHITVQKQTR